MTSFISFRGQRFDFSVKPPVPCACIPRHTDDTPGHNAGSDPFDVGRIRPRKLGKSLHKDGKWSGKTDCLGPYNWLQHGKLQRNPNLTLCIVSCSSRLARQDRIPRSDHMQSHTHNTRQYKIDISHRSEDHTSDL